MDAGGMKWNSLKIAKYRFYKEHLVDQQSMTHFNSDVIDPGIYAREAKY